MDGSLRMSAENGLNLIPTILAPTVLAIVVASSFDCIRGLFDIFKTYPCEPNKTEYSSSELIVFSTCIPVITTSSVPIVD